MRKKRLIDPKLGVRVGKAIKKYGLTQKKVAEKLNYTEPYVSNIVCGKRAVSKTFAEGFCNFLNSCIIKNMMESAIKCGCTKEEAKELALEFGENEYYAPAYFLGEIDVSNRTMQHNAEKHANEEFSNAIHTLLNIFGYEIVREPDIERPICMDKDFLLPPGEFKNAMTRRIRKRYHGARYPLFNGTFLIIKEIKTGKNISVSYTEYMTAMNAIFNSINQQLQFLSMREAMHSLLTDQNK